MNRQLSRKLARVVSTIVVLIGSMALANCSRGDQPPIRRMLVGPMELPDEAFLQFAQRVNPDIVVMGAFGAPQWAAQDDPRAWLAKWREVFTRLHRLGIRVVGTFELLNVGNSPQEAERFLFFFENRWDEELLGKRPPVTAASLLEQRTMPAGQQTGANAPRGCPVNPHWRSVAKALVKPLIDAGIDGFMTHRNMFGECGCPFCHADLKPDEQAARDEHEHQAADSAADIAAADIAAVAASCDHCDRGFRRWLADRYDAGQLQSQFGIGDLASHKLLAVYGHHREHQRLPEPLELERMKFARHAIKECFDNIFVAFGRSLKPDLLVAQWNHMPYFDELHSDRGHIPAWHVTTFAHVSADERWSLPTGLWGRGEDLFWYCNWGTCQHTQLEKRFVADVTMYAKLLRSQARGKPYVVNKYDFYRPRNMLAEAAALGMIAGAKDVPYRQPEDAAAMARYFDFLRQNAKLYANNNGQPVSDVLLVYPRTESHDGDVSGVEMVEVAGRTMIVNHMQFDMAPDDLLAEVRFENYRAIVAASPSGLNAKQLKPFLDAGGSLIAIPGDKQHAADPAWMAMGAQVVSGLPIHSGGTRQAAPLLAALNKAIDEPRLRVDAPFTVETHLYRQANDLVVHLVNYNHHENAAGSSVVERESPIAAEPISVQLALPDNTTVRRITFLDPDAERPRVIQFEREANGVRFQTPAFSVYGVCVVELEQ